MHSIRSLTTFVRQEINSLPGIPQESSAIDGVIRALWSQSEAFWSLTDAVASLSLTSKQESIHRAQCVDAHKQSFSSQNTARAADCLSTSLSSSFESILSNEDDNGLAAEILRDKKDITRKLPVLVSRFPGIRAKFVPASDNRWDQHRGEAGIDPVRKLTFVSQTPHSLFTQFCLEGRRGDHIRLTVEFLRQDSLVQSYFEQYGINLTDLEMLRGSFFIGDPRELRPLFKLLAENNEIPENNYPQLIHIIHKACRFGNHRLELLMLQPFSFSSQKTAGEDE
jgi:hypothetical protein